MTVDDYNILWLDLFTFLGYNKKIKLLEVAGKGVDIRKTFNQNIKFKEVLAQVEFNDMLALTADEHFAKVLGDYEKDNITTITFMDERYPYLLKQISSPPLCLYCKGNIQLLNTLCIGIVGSRTPSEYGIVVTKQFSKDLASAGATIVSGLAVGVDTIAHRAALSANGTTIAVLAGGFDNIYPVSNNQLYRELTTNNLVITEHIPSVKPISYHFPIRNRIIAGLSKGVLVTEAAKGSGSLHTINYAIDYNREVFAIPGNINNKKSEGTNSIIKQYNSSIVLSPEDILECFNLQKVTKQSFIQLDIEVQNLLNYIQTEKKTFQEILDFTKLKAQVLNSMLLELEMSGLVTKLANNSYIACGG